MRTVIRSIRNATVQRFRSAVAGRSEPWIVLAGERLVHDARSSGLAIEGLLVAEDLERVAAGFERDGLSVQRVARDVLDRVTRLKTSPGVLALAREPDGVEPEALTQATDALVLVVCGVQDPGNLGALARSAEAAGASGLAVLIGGARPWSEKALRGSMGSLLRLPVHVAASADELAAELSSLGVRHVACATRGGVDFAAFDYSGKVAIWIGPETGELPRVAEAFDALTIPMRGGVESLNATVAAALILYAAGRAASS